MCVRVRAKGEEGEWGSVGAGDEGKGGREREKEGGMERSGPFLLLSDTTPLLSSKAKQT